jgi:hypothetical protein
MKRKLKFQDDIPKYIWLGKRGVPRYAEEITYHDGTPIYLSIAPNYHSALERIFNSSKFMDSNNQDKYMFGLSHVLDDEDEDNFYLLLTDFKEWHTMLDTNISEPKNGTEQ